jgi:hypothetical protein
MTELSELEHLLPLKCLMISGKKLSIILMCVGPLMVTTLGSNENIKLCEVQCLKMYQFLQYTLWLKIHNVLFY